MKWKVVNNLILTLVLLIVSIVPQILIPQKAAAVSNEALPTGGVKMGLNEYKQTVVYSTGVVPTRQQLFAVQILSGTNVIGLNTFSDYAIHFTDTTVGGMIPGGGTLSAEVLAVVDAHLSENNGYPMIRASNRLAWISALGGNPDYVDDHLSRYNVVLTSGGTSTELVSLTELIQLCGGKGTAFGFNSISPNEHIKYKGYVDYVQSATPDASVSIPKTTYTVGETVKITGSGTVYSAYDRYVMLGSFTVRWINPSFPNDPSKSKYFTHMDTAGVKSSSTWTKEYNFTPPEAGTYEIVLYVTDYQRREAKTYPVIKQFTIGGTEPCANISATIQISGQPNKSVSSGGSYTLPEGINTISLTFPSSGTLTIGSSTFTGTTFSNLLITSPGTNVSFKPDNSTSCDWSKTFEPQESTGEEGQCDDWSLVMDVQIDKQTGISTIQLASGGSRDIDKTKLYGADVFSPIQGDFYYKIGGVAAVNGRYEGYSPGVSNTDRYLNIPLSDYTPVHILFVSSDGKKCWVYTFRLVDGSTKPQDPCPNVYQTVDIGKDDYVKRDDGDVIEVDLNGSIEMFAKYNSSTGKKPAYVWWELEYPDGTKKLVGGVENDRGIFRNEVAQTIRIPYLHDYGSYNVFFDRVGEYKLRHKYEPETNWADREPPCKWEITIKVKNIDCDDIILEAVSSQGGFQFTGSGTLEDPYAGSLAPGESVWAAVHARYQGNLIDTTQYTITGGHYTTPQTEEGYFTTHYYSFDPPRMYTIHAKINYYGQICEKTIYIQLGPYNCNQSSVSVKVNGASEDLDNGTLRLAIGEQPSYEVDFEALYSGSSSGVTGDWVLKKNGSTGSYTANGKNPFRHIFTDTSPGTYTLTIKVKKESLICEKTITIELEGIQCSDLRIHLYNSVDNMWKTRSSGSVKRETINSPNPVDWKLVVTNSENDPSEGGIAVKVTWTADLPNQSSNKPAEYARNGTSKGIYKVKAVVNDPAYPQLSGCEFNVEIEILDEVTCGTMYIWLFDEANPNGRVVSNGSEIIYNIPINGKVPKIGVTIGISPTDSWAKAVESIWSGTRPNEIGETASSDAYLINNVGKGTYTITAITQDPFFPKNCRYDIKIIVKEPGGGEPCTTCEPGGIIDGGKMKIVVYDSENRLLTGPNDGVWEREPARIEVEIDQSKITAALHQVDTEINQAIQKKMAELELKYADPKYEGVLLTATPANWSAQNNSQTKWPSHVRLNVDGPGGNSEFQLNPATPRQSNIFTLTEIPTQTTWRADLHTQNYHAKVDGFQIVAAYSVRFDVTFQECEMVSPGEDEEGNPLPEEKVCKPGNDSDEIGNKYTINVSGDETWFEVFEPNATSVLAHTAEWLDYHSRDRYKQSQPGDFYAGERILTRVHLEERHRHPVSGKFPRIQGAKAWINETGKNGGNLQSILSLIQESPILWKGASRNVPKLGLREEGVDTPLMGDKQKGFVKGGHYAVYFQVSFQYGVTKGFTFPNKNTSTGHQESDYKRQFTIIANAWERQGIRNHTKQ